MKKENILYFIIAVLVVVVVFLVIKNNGNYVENSEAADIESVDVAFKATEMPVEVMVIQQQNLVQSIESNGIIKAWQEAEIVPQVTGEILELNYEEGDFVEKDAVILKIDDNIYQIEFLKAKETLRTALAEYGIMVLGETNRELGGTQDSLFQEPDLSGMSTNDREAMDLLRGEHRKEMLANKAGLTSARLDLQKAEINLRNTELRAPFNGYVADLNLGEENRVQSGEEVLSIVALDRLLIEVGILETEIPLIQKQTPVKIEIPAFPGEEFSGHVKTINPILDDESSTCRIRIEMKNPENKIKPGMFAKVSIQIREFNKRLLVPREALLERDERKVTFVFEKNRAKWHYVKTGLENDDFVEILEGLSAGDSLIVSGHFNLAHDAHVVLIKKEFASN